jgi:hypothetical protein
MKPTALNYNLMVYGLFGRNRTIKRDFIKLAKRVPLDQPKSLEELRPMVKATLAEIKAKPGLTYALREEPIEVSHHDLGEGRTATTEGFMLMSERVLLSGKVGGEEKVHELPPLAEAIEALSA